jgi:hypothetical protein
MARANALRTDMESTDEVGLTNRAAEDRTINMSRR